MTVGRDQRIVRNSHQRLQIRIDSSEQCPEVVVLPEERMKAPAHRDLIITVGHRPGSHPTSELIMRLDHDHRHTALGQPDRCRDASNAPASDNDRLGQRASTVAHPAPPDDELHEHLGRAASARRVAQ